MVLRAVYAYVLPLLVLRLIGRRAVMQSVPFELILIFLFGGTAIVLRWDDQWDYTALHRSRLQVEDIMAAARAERDHAGPRTSSTRPPSGDVSVVPQK